MPIAPSFRNDSGALSSLTFTAVSPGMAGTAQEAHLWNHFGNASGDPMLDTLVMLEVEHPPGGGVYVFSGAPAVDERWFEIRTIAPEVSEWKAMGGGSGIFVAELAADSAVEFEIRPNPPLSVNALQDQTIAVALVAYSRQSLALGSGHTESSPDGVLRGIGDPEATEVIVGGAWTEVDSDTVGAPYEAWLVAGVPYAAAAGNIDVNTTDGASGTLGAGEEYTSLVCYSASGRALVKGNKAAVGSSTDPAVPAGSTARARVVRDDTGITSLEVLTEVAGYQFADTGGLTGKIGPGRARLGNMLAQTVQSRAVSLTASSTNRVWLLPSDTLQVTTTATAPSTNAQLLWEVTTDGSAITGTVDRRRFIGPQPVRIGFRHNTTLASDAVSTPDVNNTESEMYLDPRRSICPALDDFGSGTTSGETRFDLQYSIAGGAWTSFYDSDDDMPDIPHNGTDPVVVEGKPLRLIIGRGERLRSRIDAIPSGGTAPSGAAVVLEVYAR